MKLSILVFSLAVALTGNMLAQITPAPQSNAAPVSYASVTEVSGVLTPLNQASQTLTDDLGKLRVERWKADADTKRQSLANVESLQRNLPRDLPAMVASCKS